MRAVTLIALMSLPPGAILHAACTSSIYRINTADSITFHSTSFSNSALQTAAAGWNNCSQAGEEFPNIVVGSNGEMDIEVALIPGNNPDSASNGCGSFTPTVVAAGTKPLISGGQIKIYEKTYPGADCSTNYSETITHELGHALGLGNATSTSCDGNMMGAGKLVTNPDGTKSVVPDAIWTELRLWFDRNHNGATDDGELLAISDSVVKSIPSTTVRPIDGTSMATCCGTNHSQKS